MTGLLDVAGRIPRRDHPTTLDPLFREFHSDPLENLAAVPKDAIPKALDPAIAGGTGAPIRTRNGTAGR